MGQILNKYTALNIKYFYLLCKFTKYLIVNLCSKVKASGLKIFKYIYNIYNIFKKILFIIQYNFIIVALSVTRAIFLIKNA